MDMEQLALLAGSLIALALALYGLARLAGDIGTYSRRWRLVIRVEKTADHPDYAAAPYGWDHV